MLGVVAQQEINRPAADAIQVRDVETRRAWQPRRSLEQRHNRLVSPLPVGIVASRPLGPLLSFHRGFSYAACGVRLKNFDRLQGRRPTSLGSLCRSLLDNGGVAAFGTCSEARSCRVDKFDGTPSKNDRFLFPIPKGKGESSGARHPR
jgi:hypothetical protein